MQRVEARKGQANYPGFKSDKLTSRQKVGSYDKRDPGNWALDSVYGFESRR